MGIKIIDNCCSPDYLDCLKYSASNSENWNMHYQSKSSIDERFLKLDIINSGNLLNPYLAGLAMGLLVQIQQAAGQDLFIPTIYFLGISMKDKHIPDVMHVDNEEGEPFVRILGLLNSDWKEEWGGGFFHDETSNYIKPTSFAIFDGSRPHMAEEIFTDKKRFAIDFSVFKDQQSIEKLGKRT